MERFAPREEQKGHRKTNSIIGLSRGGRNHRAEIAPHKEKTEAKDSGCAKGKRSAD